MVFLLESTGKIPMRFFIIMMLFFSSMIYANISYASISSNVPSDESMERLIKAKMTKEHVINTFSHSIPQAMIVAQLFPFIVSENEDKQALKQKLAMMLELNKNSQELFQHEISTDPHWAEFIDNIYIKTEIDEIKRLYNQEQVNALIEFYESPIGKSIALAESYKDIDKLPDNANINTIIEYVENYGKDLPAKYNDYNDTAKELKKIRENSPTVRYMYSEMFKIAENLGYGSEPNPEFLKNIDSE